MSEDINARLAAVPVDSCAAFLKADVGFFRDYGFAIEASVQKIVYDETRDFAVESVFEKASVRTAFAGGVDAVAGV